MPSSHCQSHRARSLRVAIGSAVLLAGLPGGTATAAELGGIDVRMTTGSASGTDESLFGGKLPDARCPAGTGDSLFTMEGPGLRPYEAFLGSGNATGTGPQEFSGTSVANLRANNAGSFLRSGTYVVTFLCVRSPDGAISDVYTRRLDYIAGGAGSVVIRPGPAAPGRSAAPASPAAVPTPLTPGSSGPAPSATPAASAARSAPGATRPSPSVDSSSAALGGGSTPVGPTAVGQRPSNDAGTTSSAGLIGGLAVLTAVSAIVLLLARRRRSNSFNLGAGSRAER